jgi:hypothetical protein
VREGVVVEEGRGGWLMVEGVSLCSRECVSECVSKGVRNYVKE